jgi:hypothetical protein
MLGAISQPAGWVLPQPRGVTWNGAGGWLMASQSLQVNFFRTCCSGRRFKYITRDENYPIVVETE